LPDLEVGIAIPIATGQSTRRGALCSGKISPEVIVPIGISESVQVYLPVPSASSIVLNFMLQAEIQYENET
jgi:hypothetical protein